MSNGFWGKLHRPFYALAPMADVTDVAFRRVIAKYGKPDIMWTEFVSTDGLQSAGRDRLARDLEYAVEERPIVAQIFGANPENFYKSARLLNSLGFDGIDINMGCPERNIQKQGSCAALIEEPKLAQEIILATKEGSGGLPVSIKTRIGYNTIDLEAWLPVLLQTDPAAVILHWRTKKEMSKVPAHWELARRAVEIRDEMKSSAYILGNGDVADLSEADRRVAETGVDGVMIGRGIFGNPWLFNRKVHHDDISLEERFRVMLEHTYLFEELLGGVKNFSVMKKHYKAYVEGFPGAKELRIKLMETSSATEVEKEIDLFMKGYKFENL